MHDQITIKVSKETKNALIKIAKSEELSVSDVIRQCIREKLSSFFLANKRIQMNTKNKKGGLQ